MGDWSRKSQRVHPGLGEGLILSGLVRGVYGNLVGGAYFTFADWTGAQVRGVRIVNKLNISIYVSFDGGTTDHETMDAGESRFFNFAEMSGHLSSPVIKVKNGFGESDPTSGNVFVSTYR